MCPGLAVKLSVGQYVFQLDNVCSSPIHKNKLQRIFIVTTKNDIYITPVLAIFFFTSPIYMSGCHFFFNVEIYVIRFDSTATLTSDLFAFCVRQQTIITN